MPKPPGVHTQPLICYAAIQIKSTVNTEFIQGHIDWEARIFLHSVQYRHVHRRETVCTAVPLLKLNGQVGKMPANDHESPHQKYIVHL